jgi:hypothetical protein
MALLRNKALKISVNYTAMQKNKGNIFICVSIELHKLSSKTVHAK